MRLPCAVTLPVVQEHGTHVYHLFVIRVNNRNTLQSDLKEKGIGYGIHYPVPLHLQPAFQFLGCKQGDFPITEKCTEQILSLPIFPEMTETETAYIAEVVLNHVNEKKSV